MVKLNNAVYNVVEKVMYNQLVTKISVIDTKIPSTSGLVTKLQYDLDKQGLYENVENVDKKVPNTSGLVQTTVYNSKSTEID